MAQRWPNPDLRRKLERQMSALASDVLEGRVTLVASAQRLLALAHQLGLETGDAIYDDLRLIISETDHLPLGSERQYWDSMALSEKDAEIVRAEAWAREFGLNTCRLITERFPRAKR